MHFINGFGFLQTASSHIQSQMNNVYLTQTFVLGIVSTVGSVSLGGIAYGFCGVMDADRKLGLAVAPCVLFRLSRGDFQAVGINQLFLDGSDATLFGHIKIRALVGHAE